MKVAAISRRIGSERKEDTMAEKEEATTARASVATPMGIRFGHSDG